LINCMSGKSFNPDMPGSCRLVAVMAMQVADLVADDCTPGG